MSEAFSINPELLLHSPVRGTAERTDAVLYSELKKLQTSIIQLSNSMDEQASIFQQRIALMEDENISLRAQLRGMTEQKNVWKRAYDDAMDRAFGDRPHVKASE